MLPFDNPMGGFDVYQFFFIGIIALIFIVLIISIMKGIITWNYNNSQPRLTVNAKVVARRENVSSHTQFDENNMSNVNSNTSYFLTFEIESGDRMEFKVKSNEYAMIAEQDRGRLTFQGRRYLKFERML
ncbi:DUF2500 domain-containing protein [Clostridium hydrogenum]|uniref:DUF2500 domain-containing protein n=1 Tax=Clostridium hydrogenum TaxID=2855764 RepID=UPI001F3C217A|nr:DUF2500 domain-containing protein [Clostridium hydrogenum]